MGSKYTKEPWQRDEKLSRVIFDSSGISIGSMYTNEDVHRVLCCVNACAGIDDPSSFIRSNKNLIESNGKLQAFKDYVHKRLDEAGVEKEPGGVHSKAGCRIGDRLDIVLQSNMNLQEALEYALATIELQTSNKPIRDLDERIAHLKSLIKK